MWRRWGTPQNFFLVFTDEPERQLFIKKAVEVSQIKNVRISIFRMYSLKKSKSQSCDVCFLRYGV